MNRGGHLRRVLMTGDLKQEGLGVRSIVRAFEVAIGLLGSPDETLSRLCLPVKCCWSGGQAVGG